MRGREGTGLCRGEGGKGRVDGSLKPKELSPFHPLISGNPFPFVFFFSLSLILPHIFLSWFFLVVLLSVALRLVPAYESTEACIMSSFFNWSFLVYYPSRCLYNYLPEVIRRCLVLHLFLYSSLLSCRSICYDLLSLAWSCFTYLFVSISGIFIFFFLSRFSFFFRTFILEVWYDFSRFS